MQEVVSGVMIRRGRILMAQRPPTKDYAGLWETGGGKVEGDESHHDAIRRELLEEFGLLIGPIKTTPLWAGEVKREGRKSVYLIYYRVLEWSGEPKLLEHQGIGWFAYDEAIHLELTPGNTAAKQSIMDELRAAERSGGWDLKGNGKGEL